MNADLQIAREKANLTQKEVAKKARISERMYQKYEYGVEPGVRTAIRISKTLGAKVLDDFYVLWETQSEPDGNQT